MKHFKLEPSPPSSVQTFKLVTRKLSLFMQKSSGKSALVGVVCSRISSLIQKRKHFWADNTASVYVEVNLAGTISDLTTSDDAPSNHEAINSVTSSFRCNRWPASLIKNPYMTTGCSSISEHDFVHWGQRTCFSSLKECSLRVLYTLLGSRKSWLASPMSPQGKSGGN